MWLKEGGGWAGAREEQRWGEEEGQWSLHPEPTREQLSGSPRWTYTDTSAKEEAGCDGLFYASDLARSRPPYWFCFSGDP